MAREPRLIVPGTHSRKKGALPPFLLAACRESRDYLLRYHYVQAFFISTHYQYVDFEIDIIYLTQYTLGDYPREQLLFQKLEVEGLDSETFTREYASSLRVMPALKDVAILHIGGGWYGDSDWWEGWDTMMENFYFRDNPASFDIRIIRPSTFDSGITELNRHNYLKVERDSRRRLRAERPDLFESDYEVSDSDEELGAPGRFRLGYRHVPGCKCSYLQSDS